MNDASPAATAPAHWRQFDFSSAEKAADSLAVAQRIMPMTGLGARACNVEFELGVERDWSAVRAYILGDGGASSGYAPFIRRERPLKFQFGEFTLANVAVTRYLMFGEPHLPVVDSRATGMAEAAKLLTAVLPTLGPREALFFEGLPIEGPLYAALSQPASVNARFVVLPLCEPFDHQFIALPHAFDECMAQLGTESRQSLRKSQRKITKDMDGEVRTECFVGPDGADRFVTDASAVSRKTYQWHLLGLGLRDTPKTRAGFAFTAERGWFRSYILYCHNVPVAFMLGHLYGGIYYIDDIGYDPDFGKWSVGSVLQLAAVENLISAPDRPTHMDFSTGFGQHKGRFSNASRKEINLLVLPASIRNRALVATYIGVNRTSAAAVGLLDRLGIKARLKKLIRRRSAVSIHRS